MYVINLYGLIKKSTPLFILIGPVLGGIGMIIKGINNLFFNRTNSVKYEKSNYFKK